MDRMMAFEAICWEFESLTGYCPACGYKTGDWLQVVQWERGDFAAAVPNNPRSFMGRIPACRAEEQSSSLCRGIVRSRVRIPTMVIALDNPW